MFPLFHVTARSAVVTSAIWAGAPIVLRDGFSPTRFWDDVRASGATYFAYMGAVIHLLWRSPSGPTTPTTQCAGHSGRPRRPRSARHSSGGSVWS